MAALLESLHRLNLRQILQNRCRLAHEDQKSRLKAILGIMRIVEHALAHQLKDKAEAAYARGTLFEKRGLLMADWANYCAKPMLTRDVVPIKGKKTASQCFTPKQHPI